MADEHTFIYVDDSGDDTIGVSMSALLLPAENWATCLGYWMRLRAELQKEHGLPTFFEIHSNAFLSAQPLKDVKAATTRRSVILGTRLADPALDAIALARAQLELADLTLNQALAAAASAGKDRRDVSSAARLNAPDVERRLQQARSLADFESVLCLSDATGARTTRRKIYRQLLDQINAFPGAGVVTVCAADGKKGTSARVYAHLLAVVNDRLASEERWGTVIVDGTPSARTLYYREAHRALELDDRRVLEDEVLRDSSESHFIQMADICAHSAFGLRQGEAERYTRLSEVVQTANGERLTAEEPGFFMLPNKNSAPGTSRGLSSR